MIELVKDDGMIGLTVYKAWTSDGVGRSYREESTLFFDIDDLKYLVALITEEKEDEVASD